MRHLMKAVIAAASAATLVSAAAVTVTTVTAQASTASTAAARVKHEHFRIISTTESSRRLSVLATGKFVAGGHLVPGNLIDGRETDRVVFPSGSFRLERHVTGSHLPLPGAKCMFVERYSGTYSLSHGTGAWKRVSGSGHFSLKMSGVFARNKSGLCGNSVSAYQAVFTASGPIRR